MKRIKREISIFLMFIILLGLNSFGMVDKVSAAETSMTIRAYSGVPKFLDADTDPFDMTVEIIDTEHRAYDSIEPGTANATFDSDEFELEDPSVLPEIKQLSVTDVQGSLRFKVTFKNVVYIGKESQNAEASQSNKYGDISIAVSYRVGNTVVAGSVKLSVKKPKSQIQNAETKILAKPQIRLENYSYDKDKVMADKTFDLNFSVVNTSWNYNLENVKTTINGGEVFTLTNGSSNIFFDETLGPQSIMNKKISLYVNPEVKTSVQMLKISVKAEYIENGTRKDFEDELTLSLPVEAADQTKPRIQLCQYSYGKEKVMADSKFNLNFSLLNTSKVYKLENVKTTVDGGNIFTPADATINTFIDDVLEPRGTISKELSLYVNPETQTSVQLLKISVKAEYIENGTRKDFEDELTLSLPVEAHQTALIASLKAITNTKEITEGEDINIKVIASNATITKTKEIAPIAYNPYIEVKALDGFEFDSENSVINLRNLMQGEPIEKTITITPKYKRTTQTQEANSEEVSNTENVNNIGVENIASDLPAEDGPQVFRGEILLTYYDQDHKEYTERSEFSFKINPMMQMQEDFAAGGMEGEASMNGEAAPIDESADNKSSEKFGIIWKCSIFVCLIVVIVFGVKNGRGKRSLDIDDEDI